MISTIRPIFSGNALRLFLEPPSGALEWKILRKSSDTFTGPTDASAYVAYAGTDLQIVDAASLQNDTPVFYRAYYFNGSTWTASATASGTPSASYGDSSTDALGLLRERLEAGLAVEVSRGTFTPEQGYIQVLTAPPISDGGVHMPVVTVHLTNEEPAERAIGEQIAADEFSYVDGAWEESEGWLARVQIEIVGWSLNPDERIEMRKALRRILVANLSVFDAAGMVEINFNMSDLDALNGEYAANIFQVVCGFSCLAPVRVTSEATAINSVVSAPSAERVPFSIN